MIAASILKARGIHDFREVAGGFAAIARTSIAKSDFVCQSKMLSLKKNTPATSRYTPNVGQTDKIIRMMLAAVIAVLFFAKIISVTTAIALGIVAIVLLMTSMAGYCPVYGICKLNTNKNEK